MLDQIVHLIKSSEVGSISYSQYMEYVLYDRQLGYYMKDKTKIGKAGDFYTSSNVHNVFAKVLSDIFIKLTKTGTLPLRICEIGGGTGRLANYILNEWERKESDLFQALEYYIVEMSPYHRQVQRETIEHIDKVIQFETIHELNTKIGGFTGIVLSNELFDAFPVDVVQKKSGIIYEVRVSVNEQNQLIEVLIPCNNEELLMWMDVYELCLEEGQRIEIPVSMTKWIEQTKNWFDEGIMVTIDYGYTNEQWLEPIHRDGSLRGYYKHNLINNPLLYPGEMDLTTHIHLDAFKKSGNKAGLITVEMMKQTEFLFRGGILQYLQDHYDPNPFSEVSKQNRAIRTLLADDGISSSFTVMIHQKGLDDLSVEDILQHTSIQEI
ncbi:class I SAM-dependent methyltransferase [Calidifontibacillus oryziterrae]|uniref:class I SAM-dependent methyltransferase n=1 Tax=Calidifontibacillus oryziterrae TaxID=1191699 RepID=UPI0002E19416|nr:SAM-dependent methyltransferase [Calidifontibacillus oryziterrae]